MIKLDDLVNIPPPATTIVNRLEVIPDLGLEYEGRKLTPAQTENLLRNIPKYGFGLVEHLPLPEAWRKPVGHALLDLFETPGTTTFDYPRPFLVQAVEIGETSCLPRVKKLVATHPHGWMPEGFAAWLLREEGAAGLRFLVSLKPGADELKALRELKLVRPMVFDMIVKPKPDDQWRELRESGEALTAADFRACLDLPKHARHAATLDFEITHGPGATRLAKLPFEVTDGDLVRVARRAAPAVDWQAIRVSPGRLFLTLEARGWRRGPVDDKGLIRWHERAFPGLGVRAVVEYDGVPAARGAGNWCEQALRDVRFEPSAHGIAEGEVATDLRELAGP